MELEQRIIIKCLVKEGFDENQILPNLQTHIKEKAHVL
jgi:hypothetical protein